MIRIKFDSKETTLATKYSNDPLSILEDGPLEIAQLEVGDIHMYHKNQPDIPLVIIERKTIKDLAASIKDGRYKEQIIRLKSVHQHPTRIFFLIEGCQYTHSKYLKRVKELGYDNALYSAFINIMVRDKIGMLESDDMEDTCHILRKLVTQVEKKYLEIIEQSVVTPHLQVVESQNFHYSKTIKSNKKQNNNAQVCFINILSQIPGVSTNSAAFIVDQYLTMSQLIQVYLALPDEKTREKLLKDIVIKSDTGNGRKLGPIVSTRIYRYLFGIVDSSEISEVVAAAEVTEDGTKVQ